MVEFTFILCSSIEPGKAGLNGEYCVKMRAGNKVEDEEGKNAGRKYWQKKGMKEETGKL